LADPLQKPHVSAGGPGPFTTWTVQRHPVKGFLHQTSRRRRKTILPPIRAGQMLAPHDALNSVEYHWNRVWAMSHLSWWIAVLFMIGSAHFAVASATSLWPNLLGSHTEAGNWIGPVYFIGSFFFTGAAYLQWLQALNSPLLDEDSLSNNSARPEFRFWGFRNRDLGYLASAVQLLGTIFFNFNTGGALIDSLDSNAYDTIVWIPNFLGSICFLVASQLAVMEFSHSAFSFQPKQVSWWIVAVNMLGSVLFMVSASVSFMSPSDVFDIPWLANTGTFGGAICFFAAAYLLIPEFFEKDEQQ
jgi:hypothetical protein